MTYDPKGKSHSVTVVAVIRNPVGRYLILKRAEHELAYPGMYTFPGGKVEGNETVAETLTREALEEAGLQLKPGKVLLKDKAYIKPNDETAKSFSYLCEIEGEPPVVISSDFTDYKWINVAELATLPHVGIEEELRKADAIYALGIPFETLATKSAQDDLRISSPPR